MHTLDTGFKDKIGRPIFVGDLLQAGLGIADPKLKRVIRHGKRIQVVNDEDLHKGHAGGYTLTAGIAKATIVIDRVAT